MQTHFIMILHKDLKADFILANPPFNASDWGRENYKMITAEVARKTERTKVSTLVTV